MKTTVILLCLLVGDGKAFLSNRPSQQTDRNVHRIFSTTPKSPSKRLRPQKSSAADEEVPTRSLLGNLPSLASSFNNETITTSPLVLPTEPRPSSPSDPNLDLLPDWFEPVLWRGVIVVLCALWASNFAAAKLVMAEPGVDSSLYALSRFGVAVASLAPFAIRSLATARETLEPGESEPMMDLATLKESIACGSWVAFGYLGQTLGLLTTTASKSCVICSMHCVFVALVAELWRVQRATKEAIAGGTNPSARFDVMQLLPAAVAVVGVAIVELQGGAGRPTIGDALSFAQPIGFGMGYLILENIMAKKPGAALPVSAIKLAVVTAASLLMFEASPLLHGGRLADIHWRVPDFSPIVDSPVAMAGILYTGLITTALALWVESIAFVKVPATDASLILTTEPLFAAGCGAVALGETFGTSDYVGASLIVGACALSVFLDGEEAEPASS